ncbi:uridine diphosphate-N-acetylglucosamine-binding protein YvcK [Patescibacteria group bacterium]
MVKAKKKIVCLGGGTGVSMVLSGLVNYSYELKAIVTMFDDGGSSGKLGKEFNLLPPGDLRQCLFTAAGEERIAKKLTKLFSYRFKKGNFKGHNLGNLVIAAATKEEDKYLNDAINELGEILTTKAKIYPVTLNRAKIKAVFKNNKTITGEENIINNLSRVEIKKLSLKPSVRANSRAISAIKEADLIIIGPGKFYTSIVPNFLVKGISKAIKQSKAKKVFICNLMTQKGNTEKFKVEDFLKILEEYLGENIIDYVIFNTGKLNTRLIKKVRKIFPRVDFIQYNKDLIKKNKFIGTNLLDGRIRELNPSDVLVKGANQRTIVFHDSKKLAKIIKNICKL